MARRLADDFDGEGVIRISDEYALELALDSIFSSRHHILFERQQPKVSRRCCTMPAG